MPVGRIVIGSLGGLCAMASTVLLLVDNVQLMRIAVVLALWSAALATIVLAWARRDQRAAENELRLAAARLTAERDVADPSVSAVTA